MIGLKNIAENAKEIVENPHISSLKGVYEGYPAFIIANGPSLDKNIRQLKAIRERGLIVCMESAVIPLLKNNIKPDILAVIERLRNSYIYHFKDVAYPRGIALLGLALIDPLIYSSFPGERIPIFRDGETLNKWFCLHLGDGSAIDAGANVSHLAAEIALYLGADPIVFVGQDFAFGPEELTHSKDSVYSEEKAKAALDSIKRMPSVYLEGNDGLPVRSNKLWSEFKEGMEVKIFKHPERTFINATEGGARIKGAKCEKLEDAIKHYCRRSIPFRVDERILECRKKISFKERKKGLEKMIGDIERNIRVFRDAARELAERKLECKRMIRLHEKKDGGQFNQILDEGYKSNIACIDRLIRVEMLRCFLQQIIVVNYYQLNVLKKIDTKEKVAVLFEIHYSFFYQMGAVCQSVPIHLENALLPLRAELERINGLEGCDTQ